jgi:low affinity Fe/Cu permease
MIDLNKLTEWLTQKITLWTGSIYGFTTACLLIILWACFGPFTDWSDTWQLWINTGTTLITFLMVFLIQRSQNKELLAIHIKLNELIHAVREANNAVIKVEQKPESEVQKIYNEVYNNNMSEQVIATELLTTESKASAERAKAEKSAADDKQAFAKLLEEAKANDKNRKDN